MEDAKKIIDYCANEACGTEIHFGQPVYKVGHELVCSGRCLVAKLGAKTVIAGREKDHERKTGVCSI